MNYWKYTFSLSSTGVDGEVLIAHLSEFNFESFVQNLDLVEAYIPEKEILKDSHLQSLLNKFGLRIDYQKELIEDQNWNQKWESDYPVVTIGKELIVRAPFHKVKEDDYELDIQIQPKMSFGTGHHETTFLMLQYLLNADIINKDVLDMGSGTGVLAIAAHKMGARHVLAVDIEDWAFENTLENVALNSAHVDVNKGDVKAISGLSFDIILANINKNVLLADMKAYAESLIDSGSLYLSGFFGIDVDNILAEAKKLGFKLESFNEKSNWAAMHLIKTN